MTVMKVPYVDLGAQWRDIREVVLARIDEVLSSGMYLEHHLVEKLEDQLATMLNIKGCVMLNSGTDALILAMHALGIRRGDEVITVPNSFIASVAAIEHIGAKTQLVDVGPDHLIDVDAVEAAITSKTVAVMPVHLEGKMCDMSRLSEICARRGLLLIEDAAQAISSSFQGNSPGFGSNAACFSLHPLKNLNACGDSGFVASNDANLIKLLRQLRNHGQSERNRVTRFGVVSRMDSLQAVVVSERLRLLGEVVRKRVRNAAAYNFHLSQTPIIQLPIVERGVNHSYHLYVIEVNNRDVLIEQLAEQGIETRIHYPLLISDQPAFVEKYGLISSQFPNAVKQAKKILSLPIHQHLSNFQIEFVASQLVRFIDN